MNPELLKHVLSQIDSLSALVQHVTEKYGTKAADLTLSYSFSYAAVHLAMGVLLAIFTIIVYFVFVKPNMNALRVNDTVEHYHYEIEQQQRKIDDKLKSLAERSSYLQDKMKISKDHIIAIMDEANFTDEEYDKINAYLTKSLENSINSMDEITKTFDTDVYLTKPLDEDDRHFLVIKLALGYSAILIPLFYVFLTVLNPWNWIGLYHPDIFLIHLMASK